MVNYITLTRKYDGINHSWTTIVEKLKTQRLTTSTIDLRANQKAYIKSSTRANESVQKIYDALKFKSRLFVRKTKVVTQL